MRVRVSRPSVGGLLKVCSFDWVLALRIFHRVLSFGLFQSLISIGLRELDSFGRFLQLSACLDRVWKGCFNWTLFIGSFNWSISIGMCGYFIGLFQSVSLIGMYVRLSTGYVRVLSLGAVMVVSIDGVGKGFLNRVLLIGYFNRCVHACISLGRFIGAPSIGFFYRVISIGSLNWIISVGFFEWGVRARLSTRFWKGSL